MSGVGPQLAGGTGVANSRRSGRGGSGVPGGIPAFQFLRHEWDLSVNTTHSGGLFTSVTDSIGSCPLVKSSGNRPTYPSPAPIGGKNVARGHTGSNSGADSTPNIGAQAQPISVQIVGRLTNLSAAQRLWSVGHTTGAQQYTETANGGRMLIHAGTAAAGYVVDLNPHVWFFVIDGASSKIYEDDLLVYSGATNIGSQAIQGTQPRFRLFNDPGNNNGNNNCDVGFARLFYGGLEAHATILAQQQALMTIWGIT